MCKVCVGAGHLLGSNLIRVTILQQMGLFNILLRPDFTLSNARIFFLCLMPEDLLVDEGSLDYKGLNHQQHFVIYSVI